MKAQIGAVVFLRRPGEILLAMKKRGFGQGYWNGAGGKPESGESPEQAVIREAEEEIGVTLQQLELKGRIQFHYPVGDIRQWDGYIYESWDWDGEPTESEEMNPQWFALRDIPYHQMWDDDKHWLPLVLKGETVAAEFTFNANNRVVNAAVRVVTE